MVRRTLTTDLGVLTLQFYIIRRSLSTLYLDQLSYTVRSRTGAPVRLCLQLKCYLQSTTVGKCLKETKQGFTKNAALQTALLVTLTTTAMASSIVLSHPQPSLDHEALAWRSSTFARGRDPKHAACLEAGNFYFGCSSGLARVLACPPELWPCS